MRNRELSEAAYGVLILGVLFLGLATVRLFGGVTAEEKPVEVFEKQVVKLKGGETMRMWREVSFEIRCSLCNKKGEGRLIVPEFAKVRRVTILFDCSSCGTVNEIEVEVEIYKGGEPCSG